MNTIRRIGKRLLAILVWTLGTLAFLFAAAQFTALPWRLYQALSCVASPLSTSPTHILLMGGSGVPGESSLIRTYYAAEAAREHPKARLWIAMPLDAAHSETSRAYQDELTRRGVPLEQIGFLSNGRNTREQAARLMDALEKTGAPVHVRIVTSPEHIRRTAGAIRRAAQEQALDVGLSGCPTFSASMEESLAWNAEDLDGPADSARRPFLPDVGNAMSLRYNVWNNLHYSIHVLREGAALGYYRLRGWI
ncbi:MAG: YdcF family protein [Verrucomicrobiota bacterium]|jgi:uncharacterized SAM-binding protein YcdF (DUF218 family)|nr:YdcF family protein [Verrucomicrobiota bacterium]